MACEGLSMSCMSAIAIHVEAKGLVALQGKAGTEWAAVESRATWRYTCCQCDRVVSSPICSWPGANNKRGVYAAGAAFGQHTVFRWCLLVFVLFLGLFPKGSRKICWDKFLFVMLTGANAHIRRTTAPQQGDVPPFLLDLEAPAAQTPRMC